METQATRGEVSVLGNQNFSKDLILSSEVRAIPRAYRSKKGAARSLQKIQFRKRILDSILSAFGILLLLPFLPVVALIVKMSSPGPVFFAQEREGKNGESFICYKFRTMGSKSRERKKNGEPNITEKGDDRIFPFGHFLRKTNLDELPQLYNVLKGDMSLVGPRPYMVVECEYWKDVFDDFDKREQVKPGMSGLAQVKGYRGGILDKRHMRTRLNFDLIYIQSYSTRIDLLIIWRTVLNMLHLNTNAH